MNENLVIASKIKTLFKQKGFNTSATVLAALNEIVDRECAKASENAKRANRKTVMDRDFIF